MRRDRIGKRLGRFSYRVLEGVGSNTRQASYDKFLLEDIDEQTYRNLGSMGDGSVVDMSRF